MKNKTFTLIITSVIVLAVCCVAGAYMYSNRAKQETQTTTAPDASITETTTEAPTTVVVDGEVFEEVTEVESVTEEQVVGSTVVDTPRGTTIVDITKYVDVTSIVRRTVPFTGTTASDSSTSAAPKTTSTTAKPTTKATTKVTTTKSLQEVANENGYNTGKSSGPVTSSGKLPKDMTISSLYWSGYDVWGTKKYIFNDDKTAAQSKFGYNRFYDKAAGLLDFHIDECRIKFNNYEGKDWMIELWKGTYITGDIGTVGCEIGLYNRKHGKTGGVVDHYQCATGDMLPMEMTFLWDEGYNNNFKAQFTRSYQNYWWPTGFVDGQLRNKKDTSCLRVLGRITFKDSDMAQLFADSLNNLGFTEVSTFNPNYKDTFKHYKCDVIFVWQDVRD